MTDKDLIQALRENAEWAQSNEWETPITLSDNLTEAADRLEALDAVEVCYCKDCKKYTNMDAFNGNRLDFHWCSKFRNIMSEDDFCSYGERKGGQAPQREDV